MQICLGARRLNEVDQRREIAGVFFRSLAASAIPISSGRIPSRTGLPANLAAPGNSEIRQTHLDRALFRSRKTKASRAPASACPGQNSSEGAQKSGHEDVGRLVIKRRRCAVLLNDAVVHARQSGRPSPSLRPDRAWRRSSSPANADAVSRSRCAFARVPSLPASASGSSNRNTFG